MMPELFIAKPLLHRIRSDRPPGWWDTILPSILREEGGAVILDTSHAAYAQAEREHGPLFQWRNTGDAPSSRDSPTLGPAASPHRDPRALLWDELHRRPLETPELGKEHQWLIAFAARVPCGECRKHWKELLTQNPPDFNAWSASPEGKTAYARWTWVIHNAVNARINKPQFSWEEAIAVHNWQSLDLHLTPAV